MASTQNARLNCLCGAVQEPGTLLAEEAFPLKTYICHCNTCRHSTGAMFVTTGTLRERPSAASLAKCEAYHTSAQMTRHFCKTCGSQCFIEDRSLALWLAFSGIIDTLSSPKQIVDTLEIDSHAHVIDTVDQILPARLLSIKDKPIQCYREVDQGVIMTKEEVLNAPKKQSQHKDTVEARCHCGTVSFRLSRPTWEGALADFPLAPPESHRDKCIAGFCACRSCRLALGATSLQPWLFIPSKYILGADDQPIGFSLETGTGIAGVRDYRSSKTVLRSFCPKCGATITYYGANRPQVIDVSPALLRGGEGSMASDFLFWVWNRLGNEKEAVDLSLVAALKNPVEP